jgi:hypothetical protein
MELLGRVWNKLAQYERLTLLRHCKTIMSEDIKQHESSLEWDQLWPMRRDELCNVDVEGILKRNVQP